MKEADFQNKFVEEMLIKWPYMWCAKINIDEKQKNAIPDYLFCINSKFVSIEFKIQRDGRISISPLQIKELTDIKKAMGIALIVAFDENFEKILLREKRLDYIRMMNSITANPNIKYPKFKIDWDFEFSSYEHAIDLISVLIENEDF